MMHRTLTLAAVLLLALTMGCTTVQKWAAGGAVVGATVGGILGADHGILNAGEGALVGAATGGLAGALVGDQINERNGRRTCTADLAAKDAEISKLQEDLRAAKAREAACAEELKTAKRKIEDLNTQVANLTDELAKCKGSRVEMTLLSDVLFEPGKARLSSGGRKALDDAAAKIKDSYGDKYVTVEGHTDSDPIRSSGWKDNWDLGSARSLAVLRYLVSKGIDPKKASAETFGQNQPVAGNDTKAGKKQNRRAVIVIHTGWPKM